MNTKHTPTPWKLHGTTIIAKDPAGTPLFVVEFVDGKNAIADSEFIVKACNSTDEIAKYLPGIIESLERHYNDPVIAPNGKLEGMCLAIRGLKGLLAKAKGENI